MSTALRSVGLLDILSSTPEGPSVEERMPEIAKSTFALGWWPYYFTNVPMLTSTGCPYDCNFCIDGTNPYRQLPLDRLAEDLRFLDRRFPGMLIGIHDPNFAVKFDQVIDTLIDTLPPSRRVPYIMETSLTVLKPGRIKRLAESNCVVVAPGIESWNDYSKKGGAGKKRGRKKWSVSWSNLRNSGSTFLICRPTSCSEWIRTPVMNPSS